MKFILAGTIVVLFSIIIGPALAQLPFTQHAAPAGVVINTARMNDMANDALNNKWIAFANYGLGIYDGTNWTVYNISNSSLPTDSTTSIGFDGSGNAWIGTKEGAVYKSGTTFTTYNTSNSGLPSNRVTSVLTDGSLTWFGTYQGLVSYDGTNWTVFNSGNSPITNDSITVIKRDNSGNIWIGTRNGLFMKDGGNWTSYTTSNSSLNRYIIDLECDNNGRTWISNGYIGNLSLVITSGMNFIANGVLNNFVGDFYTYELPVTYSNNTNLSKDINGFIYFRAQIAELGIVKINGNTFDFFYMPPINFGITLFGSLLEPDLNGDLWIIARNRFYFYSLDLNNYQDVFVDLSYQNHRTLEINEVKAGVNVSGDMHWDFVNANYEVPKGSGKHTVFASALWVGGLDQQGQLHIASQTYRQTGKDFWPGPIDGVSVPFDSSLCIQFDQVWKIDKWKIEEFKSQFLAGNVANGTYQVPGEFQSWPAKGNGVVTGDLAPFVDFNGDGNYNPASGDYPLIKGDQMLFHVFNDSLAVHDATNGAKLGIEVHASAYAFNCTGIADSNRVLNRTTFYEYKIFNKSTHDYNDVYIGLWCDMDLGNAIDDYVGCDTTRAAGFAYNGDNDDETASGYGLNPPMQNIKILKGVLADAGDGIDNNLNGVVDEPGERTTMNHFHYYNNVNNSPVGNPADGDDYYSYMKSIWLNGQHVVDLANAPTNFVFSGVPYSGSGWTEMGVGNPPEDRRFLMSSGPFSLNSGGVATLDFAYVFTRDSLNPNGLNTSISRNNIDLNRVQNWFNNNNFPSCETYTTGVEGVQNLIENVSVYPNPVKKKLYVRFNNNLVLGLNYTIYNLLGEEVVSGKMKSDFIDTEKLSEQFYILKLETKSGFEFVRFAKM